MKLQPLPFLLLLSATTAFAAPNLSTTLTAPSGLQVYDSGTYTAQVANIGNHSALNTTLTIVLPLTNTSPTVHIMGELGAYTPPCVRSGNRLVCSFGTLRKNQARVVTFDLALPQASVPLTITATATTTTAPETNAANNTASVTPTLLHPALEIVGPRDVHNEHCTGTDLTSFFVCTLFPSSLASHDTVFNADYTLTIPEAPGYTGSWSQPTDEQLTFQYLDENGATVATFAGYSVGGDCFEGITTFGGPYNSAYEVCLQ